MLLAIWIGGMAGFITGSTVVAYFDERRLSTGERLVAWLIAMLGWPLVLAYHVILWILALAVFLLETWWRGDQ